MKKKNITNIILGTLIAIIAIVCVVEMINVWSIPEETYEKDSIENVSDEYQDEYQDEYLYDRNGNIIIYGEY